MEERKTIENKHPHVCAWCKQTLFDKPPGQSPTDEEAGEITKHILSCASNPLVQRIKELETQLSKAAADISFHREQYLGASQMVIELRAKLKEKES